MEEQTFKLDLSKGYVVIPRTIMDCPALNTFEEYARFNDLVLMASFKPRDIIVNGQRYTLQPGELYATAGFLGKRWKISRPTVIAFLSRLISFDIISKRCLYTSLNIITICGWGNYVGSLDTSLYTSFDTSFDTNINKDKIKINIVDDGARACACTREGEQDGDGVDPYAATVIADTFSHRTMMEQFCMSEGITVDDCMRHARSVVNEWQMTGVTHTSHTDARSHLLSTIRIKARDERKRPGKTKQEAAAAAFQASMERIANSIKNSNNGTN